MRKVIICFALLLSCASGAALAFSGSSSRGRGRGRGRGAVATRGRGVASSRGRGRGRGDGGAGGVTASRRGINRDWYQRRADGDPAARRRRGPRPKRWEREGDALYAEINSDPTIHFPGLSQLEIRAKAEEMLGELARTSSLPSSSPLPAAPPPMPPPPPVVPVPSSPAMWGTCSVGPVFKARLVEAGLEVPFPIQESAFGPISKGQNAVIGSATGSGKTLAFLLPILARTPRTSGCQCLVVTPSRELALQLQRQVEMLWPSSAAAAAEDGGGSAVHIVGDDDAGAGGRADSMAAAAAGGGGSGSSGGGEREARSSGEEDSAAAAAAAAAAAEAEEAELAALSKAPIVAGTPHALRRLCVRAGAPAGTVGAKLGELLRSSLRVVVIDEADQLLGTAEAARVDERRKTTASKQGAPVTRKQRNRLKASVEPSTTELLLSELPRSLKSLQLVCASATVGRSVRRQLQRLTGAQSIDKAAVLIAPDERDGKRLSGRRASLLPQTLSHRYVLHGRRESATSDATAAAAAEEEGKEVGVGGAAASGDSAASSVGSGSGDEDDKDEDEEEETEEEEMEEDEEGRARDGDGDDGIGDGDGSDASPGDPAILALKQAMSGLGPAPAIVFAGRAGVGKVVEALQGQGMRRVRLMKEAYDEDDEGAEAEAEEEDDEEDEGAGGGASASATASWREVPVYVGAERWGRGLDLDVDYVFLLSPPTSGAAYAHLAGRTGRKGNRGTAITLLTHTQAPRLVAISEMLGVGFEAL